MIRALILAAVFSASSAQADVPERLALAFRGWVVEAGAKNAVLTIFRNGRHHSDVALGMAAQTPVELASVGKSVTALCAVHLIKTGVWTSETTSQEVLGEGPAGLTVADFMTHSAGLGPDQTQRPMQRWLDRKEHRAGVAASHALDRKRQTSERGSYFYNNENYAILGAMIAAETGQPYDRYCKNAVLAPAGAVSARLSPRTGSMASWGGWQMSVQDYARFMHWAYGPQGYVGSDPAAWPQASMGGGAFYGAGMVQRGFRGSMNYWHFGLLCFPGRLNAGSYAVRWMEEWSVVAAFDQCTDWDTLFALDSALARAVFK